MDDPVLPVDRSPGRFDLVPRDPQRRALAVVLAVALVGIGWFALRPRPSASPPGASPAGSETSTGSGSSAQANGRADSVTSTVPRIVVHVAGAVARPGVVSLPTGSRVIDAIDAAGGPTRRADPDQLDLAAKVVDGTRIEVPNVGDRVAGSGAVPGATSGGVTPPDDGPVNLNTATQAQLEELPGVGPTLAAAILTERERLGGFSAVTDLRRVHGIGDRRFEQLQPLVSV